MLSGGLALLVCRHRHGFPPGFASIWRWASALFLLVLVLWIGVLLPAATSDLPQDVDPSTLDRSQLAISPLMLTGTALLWALLAFGAGPKARRALGLAPARPIRELALGAVVGVGIWAVVIAFMMALGLVLMAIGEGELPASAQAPAPLVVWLASLPVAWRLGLSIAAGVSEEIFFRGMLQSRIGIVLTTALFVLGHMVYGAPLMLVGISLLSLIYGALVRWRGNVVSAIAAHTVFDAVQLLVVIPATLGALSPEGGTVIEAGALALAICYAWA